MDKTIDSELTMVTNNAFNNVLQCIQNSCLNYRIQLSPFSAVISLKKSLVKDKSGTPTLPNEEMKNGLDMEIVHWKRKYEDLVIKYTSAVKTIEVLEHALNAGDQFINEAIVSPKAKENSAEATEAFKNAIYENRFDNEVQERPSAKCDFNGIKLEKGPGITTNDDSGFKPPRVSRPVGRSDPSLAPS